MASWPVHLKEDLDDVQRGQVPDGEPVSALWATISGNPRAAIWIVCPRCGTLGHCPVKGSAEAEHSGRGWDVTDADGALTMRPSILCNSTIALNAQGRIKRSETPCGGHYYLTNGVLEEI